MTVPMFADASVPNPEPAPRDLDAAFGTKQHASSGDDSTPRSVPPGRAQAEAMLGKVDAALAASKTFKASSPNSALESPNSGEDDGVFPDEARVVPAGPPDGSSTYPLAASDAETPRESTAPREGVPGAGATPDVRGESTAALATGVGERPSAADLVRAGDGGGAGDASAADDPSAAPDLDAETRAACLARFVATDDEGRLAELRAMGQKELQETFRAAFRRATTSNNNQWLRRRIAGAMGLERLVGGASHAGAAGASARKSSLAGLQAPAGTTGPAGGFLPARAGSGLEKAGGTIVAEDGVRKSSRTAKPKIATSSRRRCASRWRTRPPGSRRWVGACACFGPRRGRSTPASSSALISNPRSTACGTTTATSRTSSSPPSASSGSSPASSTRVSWRPPRPPPPRGAAR